MSGFLDNASKIVVDCSLGFWPSVDELAPVKCHKENGSRVREPGSGVREDCLRRALRAEL